MKTSALLFILGLFAMANSASLAWGHSAPMGWEYEARCCSGRDCAQIEPTAVRITENGYVVTLEPGDHPFVTVHTVQTFRFPDADPNNNYPVGTGLREASHGGDEHYHACVIPGGKFICLYVPDTGA